MSMLSTSLYVRTPTYTKSIDSSDVSCTKDSSTCMCCLLEGGPSQIGCCSSCPLHDCDPFSFLCFIIGPSDGSDSKSDDICDDDSNSEMGIGVVARLPTVALATRCRRAVCSRFKIAAVLLSLSTNHLPDLRVARSDFV